MSDHVIENSQIANVLKTAKSLHRSQKSDEANRIYIQILEQYPDNVEAMRLRAVVYMEKGYFPLAEEFLLQALSIDPKNPSAYNNLGSLYFSQKEIDKAIQCFRKALNIDPEFSQAANNLGNVWQELGEADKAIAAYELALTADPKLAPAWNNLGNTLSRCNRSSDASKLFLKALELDPNYKDAWNNLGISYATQGFTEQALQAYNRALELARNDALTLNNKGNLLLKNNNSQEALICFEASTRANGLLPESWNGCGFAYKQLGRLKDAERSFRKSIELQHDYAEAWNNLGLTLAEQGKLDAALSAFGSALEIRPSYSECHSNLLLFLNYHPEVHAQTLHDAHLNWAAAHQLYPTEKSDTLRINKGARKIRIGFVSADLCRHPIGYFLQPLLKHLDKSKFEITCYSNNSHNDDMTLALRKHSEHWMVIASSDSISLADKISHDKIDILIDLSGHTSGNKLEAFSLRAAPIQMSWLGYPCTTALDKMDYYLSDGICLPEYTHWQFTERVLTMPNSRCCYSPPAYAPEINELPALKNQHVTFGSFNNPVKLNAQTFQLWSDILKRSSCSKLVLSWKTLSDPSIANSIRNQFAELGINHSRIILLGGQRSHEQVFRDYREIDIALDTFPFSGGLTSCEALWMGVPIVTLAGKRPASRQTAGLLSEIGLDRLVYFTMTDYVDGVLDLAADRTELSMIRNSLRDKMLRSTLCDAERFSKDFESVMSRVYMRESNKAHHH